MSKRLLPRLYTVRMGTDGKAANGSYLDNRGSSKQTAFIARISAGETRRGYARGRIILADPTTSRVTATFRSTLESVDKVEEMADQYARRAGFDEDTAPHISMAVREAAVNAVIHGNGYDPAKRFSVEFETTAESLIVRVCDEGRGLDPETIPDPLAPENILRGSGRGIFLIRAFMDEVNFRKLNPGTEVSLTKHRSPAQPGT